MALFSPKSPTSIFLFAKCSKNRGSKRFSEISKQLYGSTGDHLVSDKNTVLQMSLLLYKILTGIKNTLTIPGNEKNLSADQAMEDLNGRFLHTYGDHRIEAVISDGIISDAAAGGDKIKLRKDAMFSKRDLDIFEVHEGWVHVGTTINGRLQNVAKWLSIGPPRCTSTQEGLAVLMEIFTFRTSVMRAQIINDRIIAVAKAEDGANLVEVFEYFRTEGYGEEDCIKNSFRVFRGVTSRAVARLQRTFPTVKALWRTTTSCVLPLGPTNPF